MFLEREEDESGDGITGDPILRMVRAVNDLKKSQSEGQRRVWLLQAATMLYPHIAVSFPSPEDVGAMKVGADITELDKSRALRAVDLAFGMEQVIQARIDRVVAMERR